MFLLTQHGQKLNPSQATWPRNVPENCSSERGGTSSRPCPALSRKGCRPAHWPKAYSLGVQNSLISPQEQPVSKGGFQQRLPPGHKPLSVLPVQQAVRKREYDPPAAHSPAPLRPARTGSGCVSTPDITRSLHGPVSLGTSHPACWAEAQSPGSHTHDPGSLLRPRDAEILHRCLKPGSERGRELSGTTCSRAKRREHVGIGGRFHV